MKITLPEGYHEITVGQYKELYEVYNKEEFGYQGIRRCIELLAGIEKGDLIHARFEDIEKATHKIKWLLDEPDALTMKSKLQARIVLNGRKYGFIPDWTRLTVAEFADLETYCSLGVYQNIDKMLSVLYRPIIKEDMDMYEIEPYEPNKERQHLMNECTMDVCVSAIVFFCNIQKAFVTITPPYLKKKEKKRKRKQRQSEASGVGIKSFIRWLKGI